MQRLIVSIISAPDEDTDISLKDSQSLVNVILLLAHHLEPDGPQVHIARQKYATVHLLSSFKLITQGINLSLRGLNHLGFI